MTNMSPCQSGAVTQSIATPCLHGTLVMRIGLGNCRWHIPFQNTPGCSGCEWVTSVMPMNAMNAPSMSPCVMLLLCSAAVAVAGDTADASSLAKQNPHIGR